MPWVQMMPVKIAESSDSESGIETDESSNSELSEDYKNQRRKKVKADVKYYVIKLYFQPKFKSLAFNFLNFLLYLHAFSKINKI